VQGEYHALAHSAPQRSSRSCFSISRHFSTPPAVRSRSASLTACGRMTLRDLMGHEDASTTQRYVTLTSTDKRNAIERTFGQQVGNTLPNGAEDPQILVEKL
jgi:integrase